MYKQNLKWDDPIDDEIAKKWLKWRKFDGTTRQKFAILYESKRLGKYHELYISTFFRRISKWIWSIQLYNISK